jgi:hypothetical protein
MLTRARSRAPPRSAANVLSVKRSRARSVRDGDDTNSRANQANGEAALLTARAVNEASVYRTLLQQLRERLQHIMMLEDRPIVPMSFDQDTEAAISRTQGEDGLLRLKAELEQLSFMLQQLQDNTIKNLERDEGDVLAVSEGQRSRRGKGATPAAPAGPTAEQQEIADLRTAKQQQEQLTSQAATVIQAQLEALRRVAVALSRASTSSSPGSSSGSIGSHFQSANDLAVDVPAFEAQVGALVTRLGEAERLRSETEVALRVATESAALELAQARAALAETATQADRLAEELRARTQNVTNRDASIVLTREEVAEVRRTLATAEAERDKAQADVAALTLRFGLLDKADRDLRAEHQAMTSRALAAEASLQSLRTELHTSLAELTAVTQAREQLQTQQAELAAQKDAVDAQLAALTVQHAQATREKVDLERNLRAAVSSDTGLAATLQTKLTASEALVEQVRKELTDRQASIAALTAQLERKETARAQLDGSARRITDRADSLQQLHARAIEELEAVRTAKTNELAALQRTVDSLKDVVAEKERLATEAAQEASTEIANYEAELKRVRKLNSGIKEMRDKFQVDLVKAEGTLRAAKEANDDLATQLATARLALATATEEINAERQKRQAAEQKADEERLKREAAERAVTGERQKLSTVERENRNLAKLSKKVVSERTAEVAAERQKREAVETEREDLRRAAKSAITEHTAQIAQLNQQIQTLELHLTEETSTKKEATDRNKVLDREISELRQQARAATEQLAAARAEKRQLEEAAGRGTAQSAADTMHDLGVFEKYTAPGYTHEPALKDDEAFRSAQKDTLQRMFRRFFDEKRRMEAERNTAAAEWQQRWTKYTTAVRFRLKKTEECLNFLEHLARDAFGKPDLAAAADRAWMDLSLPQNDPITSELEAVAAWRQQLRADNPFQTEIDAYAIPRSLTEVLKDAQTLHATLVDYGRIWSSTGSAPPPTHPAFVRIRESAKQLSDLRAQVQRVEDEHLRDKARLRGIETPYTGDLQAHVRNLHRTTADQKELDPQVYVKHLRAIDVLCLANNRDLDVAVQATLSSTFWTPEVKRDIHTLTTLLRLSNREWAPGLLGGVAGGVGALLGYKSVDATLWEHLASVNPDDPNNHLNDKRRPRSAVKWDVLKAGIEKLHVGLQAILLVLPPELYETFTGDRPDDA